MTLPYRWHPSGTRITPVKDLEPGVVVAWKHAAWRVVNVTPRPEELWSGEARDVFLRMGETYRPHMVVLRPVDAPDDPRHRGRDVHLESRGHYWDAYPDGHYPICAECGEPQPCREVMAEREAERAAKVMGRYEVPGVCPSCEEAVTARQRSRTFTENLEVPCGPPVTFHVGRHGCRRSAARYEKRWAALDPDGRTIALSCDGHVINHNDGTYECTEWAECPGPEAEHTSYSACACPDCHAGGYFGCTPDAKARLVVRSKEVDR